MKEFIDKLIERLEEYRNFEDHDNLDRQCIDGAIEIVNELAEEYKGGWIACSERLPEQTEYFQTAEYTVTMRFVKNGKKSRPFTSHASFDFEAEKWLIKEYEVIAWREQIAPYTEGE